jgi:hypothetical protein
MDKRKKLSDEQVIAIKRMLDLGVKPQSIAWQFHVSSTHVYRIQAAMRKGIVNLKPTSLSACLDYIRQGWGFKRSGWTNYCYYDLENMWFIKSVLRGDHGDDYEIIMYTLDLTLEDLVAKDWVVLMSDEFTDMAVVREKGTK